MRLCMRSFVRPTVCPACVCACVTQICVCVHKNMSCLQLDLGKWVADASFLYINGFTANKRIMLSCYGRRWRHTSQFATISSILRCSIAIFVLHAACWTMSLRSYVRFKWIVIWHKKARLLDNQWPNSVCLRIPKKVLFETKKMKKEIETVDHNRRPLSPHPILINSIITVFWRWRV